MREGSEELASGVATSTGVRHAAEVEGKSGFNCLSMCKDSVRAVDAFDEVAVAAGTSEVAASMDSNTYAGESSGLGSCLPRLRSFVQLPSMADPKASTLFAFVESAIFIMVVAYDFGYRNLGRHIVEFAMSRSLVLRRVVKPLPFGSLSILVAAFHRVKRSSIYQKQGSEKMSCCSDQYLDINCSTLFFIILF